MCSQYLVIDVKRFAWYRVNLGAHGFSPAHSHSKDVHDFELLKYFAISAQFITLQKVLAMLSNEFIQVCRSISPGVVFSISLSSICAHVCVCMWHSMATKGNPSADIHLLSIFFLLVGEQRRKTGETCK